MEELWRGVADGRIKMVTSDDAAYSWEAKLYGRDRFDLCPNGIPGIEARFPLLYSEGVAKGRISLPRFVEIVSSEPARLFGMAPRKGKLEPGADADLVLFDPEARWTMGQGTLHMAADWSAYEGIEVTGKILKFSLDGKGHIWHPGPFNFANGMALAPGGKALYVTLSFLPGVERIAIAPDGSAGERSLVCTLPETVPDGLAFDAEGNLYVSC